MTTRKQINQALAAANINGIIERGNGYYYFTGESFDMVKEQGVYGVGSINALTVDGWVSIAKDKIAESKK